MALTRSAQRRRLGVGDGVGSVGVPVAAGGVAVVAGTAGTEPLDVVGVGWGAAPVQPAKTTDTARAAATRVEPMSSISVSPRTLGDVIPGGLVRSIALVVGGAVFVGLTAQISIPLWFTPVPLTLQTFSVLLVGAVLGSTRGLASMGLYLLAGVAGVPWFADHNSGWHLASIGYVVGFVAAAGLVGFLAERRGDRTPLRAAGLMVLGNLVIYACGVAGLLIMTPMNLATALGKGVLPFLLGDAIKIVFAAALLPVSWKLVDARRDS
jgi:biotin transport system substrate-specific component